MGNLTQKELEKTFQQIVDLWIMPEIEKRKKKGWKEEPIRAAQIIIHPNIKPCVKLNNQVKVKAEIKINRDIKKGESIFEKDIIEIKNIIIEGVPKDSAYVVLIILNNRWIMRFDFRYYKGKVKEHIEAAREFYDSAKENLDKNRLRPFFENCWGVAELLSACNFLLLGQKYGSHDINIEKMKGWANLGNVKIEFSEILEKLSRLRSSARYLKSKDFKKEDCQKIFSTIKEMFEFTKSLVN